MTDYLVGGHTVSKHAYTVITEQQNEITRLKSLLAYCKEALALDCQTFPASKTFSTSISALAAIEKEGL